MIYMSPAGPWSGTTTTNSSYSTNAFVVAWSQPPSEDDGGGALVGARGRLVHLLLLPPG